MLLYFVYFFTSSQRAQNIGKKTYLYYYLLICSLISKTTMSSTCTCIVFLSNTFTTCITSLYCHIKRQRIRSFPLYSDSMKRYQLFKYNPHDLRPLLNVRTHNAIKMWLLGENDVATSFLPINAVIITSCIRSEILIMWISTVTYYVFKCSFYYFTALQLCNQQQERCVWPGCDVWEYRILLVGDRQESQEGENAIHVDHSWWSNARHKEDQKPTSSW